MRRLKNRRSAAHASELPVKRSPTVTVVAAATAVASLAFASSTPSTDAAPQRTACRAPKLRKLTLSAARSRAASARCTLHVEGAAVKDPAIQTVRRQSVRAGTRTHTITVWVNPLCAGSADGGGPPPSVRRGRTALVTGFYLDGGPLRRWSSRGCQRHEPTGAGTVQVLDSSGTVLATRASAAGHLLTFRLRPGTYTVRGTFEDATINGQHPTQSMSVRIRAHHVVRRDFVLPIR